MSKKTEGTNEPADAPKEDKPEKKPAPKSTGKTFAQRGVEVQK
jgi:hypothetical protein